MCKHWGQHTWCENQPTLGEHATRKLNYYNDTKNHFGSLVLAEGCQARCGHLEHNKKIWTQWIAAPYFNPRVKLWGCKHCLPLVETNDVHTWKACASIEACSCCLAIIATVLVVTVFKADWEVVEQALPHGCWALDECTACKNATSIIEGVGRKTRLGRTTKTGGVTQSHFGKAEWDNAGLFLT